MKTDSKEKEAASVLECSASYYNPISKKWDFGSFTLNKNHIQFICNSVDGAQFHLCLPLSTITSLEKRQSNFIYPALVTSVGAEKHWFRSFSSRDAVYNLLELFWRESLISRPHKRPSLPKVLKNNSSLGEELLGILSESENTLIWTANELSDQSRQLYEAEVAVEDLNNDLKTAEDTLKSLSLPLTLANFANNNKNNPCVNATELPSQRYKVTFSFSNDENKIDWASGVLVITGDVILLKVEDNVIMQVTKDELELFQVLTPWELCITHTFSGIRKSCYLICPQLSRLLKFVTSIPSYQEKIAYTDDSSVCDTASCSSSIESAVNSPSSPSTSSKCTKKIESDSNQIQTNCDVLSTEEFEELSNALQNLQTLAVEVCKEQENQMERINTLVENMEITEERLKVDNKIVKKLT